MCGYPIDKAKEACDLMVSQMIDLNVHRVGLVAFSSYGEKLGDLSNDLHYLRNSIGNLYCKGSTDMAGGLRVARTEVLNKAINPKIAILVTDGYPNSHYDADKEGEILKQDTKLITIGIGDGVDEPFLQKLATSYDDYYSGADFSELASIFQAISSSLRKL